MNRSPEDPNNEPTQLAGYGYNGNGNYGEQAYSEYREPTGRRPEWTEPPPPRTPWYLRPVALIGLGVLTALLIALLVWGMVRLVNKEPSPSAPATSSVTSTTTAPSEESVVPGPEQAPSQASTEDDAPPATDTQPPASTTDVPTTTTTQPPTTTEPPTTTAAPTTTAPTTTTAAPSTTSAPATPTLTRQPPAIIIPLPGL